ncbi:mitochondrial sodium/calcium exchanger protein [Drosophila grimshawi]|nr:mitochondrial sodium/calcium exchanger protein [Drosophila grimshawi]
MIEDHFKYFKSNTSCHSLLRMPFDYRCMMARELPNCKEIISYFNYFELIYCYFHIHELRTETCVMLLLSIAAIIYFFILSIVVDTYFTPILKILSIKLHMNEYLAGVTFLAFANSSPDLIANLMPIRADAAIFTCTISNALTIVLLCGGMICYLKPFKMDGHSTVRNLLFLLLGVELLRHIMFSAHSVTKKESVILLSLYVIYLLINIADLILMRYTIKNLRVEIEELSSRKLSMKHKLQLKKKMKFLAELESNEIMNFHKRNSQYFSPQPSNANPVRDIFSTRRSDVQRPTQMDFKSQRTILHNANNAKNVFLLRDFFESLNPIDAMDWQLSGYLGKILIVLKSPFLVLITAFVPVVDYEQYKHGWSKLLNCTQIVTNPFIVITAVHSKFASVYSGWYIDFNYSYSKWSLCLTIPLAICVFLHARTDLPPPYHMLFITLGVSSSVVLITLCVGEIEMLNSIVGVVFNLSENFMDITFGSITNATIDLMANFALTKQGYEKMAYAAICAGPFFSIVVGMGVALLFNVNAQKPGSDFWLYGENGDNCYIFVLITIVTQLWWCLTVNFYARRSAGIFAWALYAVFLIYVAGAEWDLVHDFTRDLYFEPK